MIFKKQKTALIVGCGRLGANLAGNLSEKNYDVTVIDKNSNTFKQLADSFSGYSINAEGSDIGILENCGINKADIVMAVTKSDSVNSMVAQVAKKIYGVREVFVRLNSSDLERVLEDCDVKIIYPFKLAVKEFEKLSGADNTESGGVVRI